MEPISSEPMSSSSSMQSIEPAYDPG
jgi:hypothetical protein